MLVKREFGGSRRTFFVYAATDSVILNLILTILTKEKNTVAPVASTFKDIFNIILSCNRQYSIPSSGATSPNRKK